MASRGMPCTQGTTRGAVGPSETGADALEEPFASDWRSATDQAVRVRAVVDQVATLTDASASRWHARWCGMLSSQL